MRGKVERAFGTLKQDYGFRQTRHLGCDAMAFNLKKAALMLE